MGVNKLMAEIDKGTADGYKRYEENSDYYRAHQEKTLGHDFMNDLKQVEWVMK